MGPYSFKTAPAVGAAGSYRVWALGDVGTGNGDQAAVRDAFLADYAVSAIDAVLLMGDSAYGYGTDDQYTAKLFAPFAGVFQAIAPFPGSRHGVVVVALATVLLMIAWFVKRGCGACVTVARCAVMGNHDWPNSVSLNESGPYYAAFDMPAHGEAGGVPSGSKAYYSFTYGNIHVIVLNSVDVDRCGQTAHPWLSFCIFKDSPLKLTKP